MSEEQKGRSMAGGLKPGIFTLFGGLLIAGVVVFLGTAVAGAEGNLEATRREVQELKEKVGELAAEVDRLKEAEPNESPPRGLESTLGKLKFGGYGEVHANFTEGTEKDKADFHRLVLYLRYDFADWITFHSETELEHAFVSDGDGEISIEQAYVDFLLSGGFNIRAGRILQKRFVFF